MKTAFYYFHTVNRLLKVSVKKVDFFLNKLKHDHV